MTSVVMHVRYTHWVAVVRYFMCLFEKIIPQTTVIVINNIITTQHAIGIAIICTSTIDGIFFPVNELYVVSNKSYAWLSHV